MIAWIICLLAFAVLVWIVADWADATVTVETAEDERRRFK
jgi:ferric-dicitrate binding protein FerR (iron transport regulator)